MAFHWPRASPLFAVFAFRAVTAVGLLTGIATVFWQIRWNVVIKTVNWGFDLEICFGIYGLFLASTSYYLTQIQASSWAKFHIAVSVIGVLLDIVLLGYHANTLSNLPKEIGPENNYVMISVALVQAINNCFAIYLSSLLVHKAELRSRKIVNPDRDEEIDTALLTTQ